MLFVGYHLNIMSSIVPRPPVAPASMAVTADPDRILYTGEVVTLTCDITLDPAVYTEVAVTASWTGPGGPITAGVVDMTDAAPYQSTLTLSSLMTSDAGDYTCTASVDPEPAATFLSAIENATGIQTITIGNSKTPCIVNRFSSITSMLSISLIQC